MDHHGDHYGAWLGESRPDPAGHRSEEEWEIIAGYIRFAAGKVGPKLPVCLPGEMQQCGRSYRDHVLPWAAALKAAAQHMIEKSAPSQAQAAYATGPLYQMRLAELRVRHAARTTPEPPLRKF